MPFLELKINAPAKINLHLAVLDKRPDCFHNLESIFFAVDLNDTLYFKPFEAENSAEITMEGILSSVPIPLEKNIIFKALSLFRAKTGFSRGLKIKVEKRIPFGGGLGGGSSNAASALLAMNRLAGGPLSRDELLQMAAAIGSDVPFFIHETGVALVTGRGEKIRPLKAPNWFFVLVNPGFQSDTCTAFKLLDKNRNSSQKSAKAKKPNNFSSPGSAASLCDEDFELFVNDFLNVFEEPEKLIYNSIISDLHELGAQYANISGTGSTCFGVFGEIEKAKEAAASLRNKWNFVECCSVQKEKSSHCK